MGEVDTAAAWAISVPWEKESARTVHPHSLALNARAENKKKKRRM